MKTEEVKQIIHQMREAYRNYRPEPSVEELLDFFIANKDDNAGDTIKFVEAVEDEDHDTEVILEIGDKLYAFRCWEGSKGHEFEWTGEARKVQKVVKQINVYE